MKQYLNLMQNILDNGCRKENRTDVYTLALFGAQMRFNLADGFPLVTTRPIWFQGIVEELLWFLSGSTNAYDLPEVVQKWWLPWADYNGQLGPTYGQSLRAFHPSETIIEVPIVEPTPETNYAFEKLTPEESNDSFVGQEIQTSYGLITVLGINGKTHSGHKKYRIQFHTTGWATSATKNNITRSIKDRYAPIIAGVGYLGDLIVRRSDPYFFLYSIWQGMIKRCYDINDPMYIYGNKGIRVHKDWHCFSTFYRHVQELPNWCYAAKSRDRLWHLDKDYFNGRVYSRQTCVWLSREDNSLYAGTPIIAISPEDNCTYHLNQRACANALGLNYKYINKVLRGHRPNVNGFRFEYTEKRLRKPLPFDQIGWLLNELRHNPNSRRLVLTTWNASQIGQCRLPPCHGLVTQFNVIDNQLSCLTYQRSCDFPIGVPANIASYALLTHIIAEMTGLQVGELIYIFADAHIYEDQIKGVKEQLSRTPRTLPTLKINNTGRGINSWTFDDFKLIGYTPVKDQIHYPVSV